MGKYSLRNAGKQYVKLTEESFKRFKISPRYYNVKVRDLGTKIPPKIVELFKKFEENQHDLYDSGEIISLLGNDIDLKEQLISIALRGMASRLYICRRETFSKIVDAEMGNLKNEDGTNEYKLHKAIKHNDFIVIDVEREDLIKKPIMLLDRIMYERYVGMMPTLINFHVEDLNSAEFDFFLKSEAFNILSNKGFMLKY